LGKSRARRKLIDKLAERGIDFDERATVSNQPDANPLDLPCHIVFNTPLHTRRERAQRFHSEKKDFFYQYGSEARGIFVSCSMSTPNTVRRSS